MAGFRGVEAKLRRRVSIGGEVRQNIENNTNGNIKRGAWPHINSGNKQGTTKCLSASHFLHVLTDPQPPSVGSTGAAVWQPHPYDAAQYASAQSELGSIGAVLASAFHLSQVPHAQILGRFGVVSVATSTCRRSSSGSCNVLLLVLVRISYSAIGASVAGGGNFLHRLFTSTAFT